MKRANDVSGAVVILSLFHTTEERDGRMKQGTRESYAVKWYRSGSSAAKALASRKVVMASWRDVRRIVQALPDTGEKSTNGETATWTVHGKSFAWERPLRKSDLEALGKNAPTGAILGIRTADLEFKDALLASDPGVFFTTPHFDGYPAVLIVLGKISTAELWDVLVESWLARAPKRAADAFPALKKPAPRRAKS